ncbi:hypothetical protein [Flavobacterium psychrotrophum]|uniref:hypothetical protein n=1 Tax=Flavobacterium psychrotrophum TaxID=2294119 RepID=UPI0013C4A5BA|nr:hypothetical protein [Flavobacterium psychrotrophum]
MTANEQADTYFEQNKEAAKTDFDKACSLYRGYVGKAETREERQRRINQFRRG